jgi:hypothetical protein
MVVVIGIASWRSREIDISLWGEDPEGLRCPAGRTRVTVELGCQLTAGVHEGVTLKQDRLADPHAPGLPDAEPTR